MEIMRCGRVILERRSLPYSSSTSVGMASPANPRPRLPRRAASTVRPASFARTTRPQTARPSRSITPVRPRAPPTAPPFTPTPLQSIDPSRPTYIPGRGLGRRLANVTYASPAFREASQAARRAHSMNDCVDRDAPSASRRKARLPSEDSDSDDQPLAQRLRCRTPHPVPDSSPSAIPSSSPLVATASPPSPPIATPPPHRSTKVGPSHRPSHRPSTATSPPEPSQVPPSAPSGSAVGPSGLAARPSQPPPPVSHFCRTTAPSEVGLQSRYDVPTSFLIMKGRLATLWGESMHQIELLPPHAQMERFSELYIKACAESLIVNQSFHSIHHQNKVLRDRVAELELQLNDPAQASHALRAEIKDLTKRKNHLEVSLAHTNHRFKVLQEEKIQVDVAHQQRMDQQTLEHQRSIDQLTQKLRAAETLAQEQDKKLKFQVAQLISQTTELLTARTELAQAPATTEGVSTALAIYKEGENDRCQ
ncbi:nascent polypeptide-associated complex subunit alpha, muscle-specific form-like [Zingiber officinale]|uniref:nascent polypeptide-associated complex subunit alpha, muscle-specific form-like n=1 Tax=Zingiber officinale TaxID=94328 RepID=UPI001C4C75FC|nr:nascent polypeptide-associated complex subunit alpha, muscle-specific form-like [Zingiber officinale]